jgi:DNA-binding NarL/FixJ family response regulator
MIGLETVKTHIKHILDKLAVSDRTQAAIKALRDGIV